MTIAPSAGVIRILDRESRGDWIRAGQIVDNVPFVGVSLLLEGILLALPLICLDYASVVKVPSYEIPAAVGRRSVWGDCFAYGHDGMPIETSEKRAKRAMQTKGTSTSWTPPEFGQRCPRCATTTTIKSCRHTHSTFLREKFKFFAGKDPARLKFEGTFTIDPRKSPKTFDASWEPEHGSISKGIYLLEGDHLTLCWGGPERPTEFPSKPGQRGHLLIHFSATEALSITWEEKKRTRFRRIVQQRRQRRDHDARVGRMLGHRIGLTRLSGESSNPGKPAGNVDDVDRFGLPLLRDGTI